MGDLGTSRLLGLTGIYHADGSLLGELRYVTGKLLGTAHCALCDITHGRVRKKRAFSRLQQRLEVPMDLVHLDERDDELAVFTDGRTPSVVGRTDHGLVMLLDAEQLELAGSVERFEGALHEAIASAGLAVADARAQ